MCVVQPDALNSARCSNRNQMVKYMILLLPPKQKFLIKDILMFHVTVLVLLDGPDLAARSVGRRETSLVLITGKTERD